MARADVIFAENGMLSGQKFSKNNGADSLYTPKETHEKALESVDNC
jgi:hypothetical protein